MPDKIESEVTTTMLSVGRNLVYVLSCFAHSFTDMDSSRTLSRWATWCTASWGSLTRSATSRGATKCLSALAFLAWVPRSILYLHRYNGNIQILEMVSAELCCNSNQLKIWKHPSEWVRWVPFFFSVLVLFLLYSCSTLALFLLCSCSVSALLCFGTWKLVYLCKGLYIHDHTF